MMSLEAMLALLQTSIKFAEEKNIPADRILFAIDQGDESSKDIQASCILELTPADVEPYIVVALSDKAITPVEIEIDCLTRGLDYTTVVDDNGTAHIKVSKPEE